MPASVKTKLFISHANPADNYFALWLSSKLQLMGYATWVDAESIAPGEYFNQLYEQGLRNEAVLFLPILTAAYLHKSGQPDTGVANELSLARIVGKQQNTAGFIVPILMDQTLSNNDFPVGIVDRDLIDFSRNWGDGLSKLVAHLKSLELPVAAPAFNILGRWYDFLAVGPQPLAKVERYYSNWLPVTLPDDIYVYKCDPAMLTARFPYAFIVESCYVIGFFDETAMQEYQVPVLKCWLFKTDEFKRQTVDLHEFQIQDARKKLIKLMNTSLIKYAPQTRSRKHEMASDRFCYFYSSGPENIKQISLEHIGKKRRTIVGKTKGSMWHFGLSFEAILHPLTAYRVNYHVLYTDTQTEALYDTKTLQKLRKSSTVDWYNEKWFETIVAFLYRFSNFATDFKIRIPCHGQTEIVIDTVPLSFESEVGYQEPVKEEDEA